MPYFNDKDGLLLMNRIGGVTILRKGNSDLISDGDTGRSFANVSLILSFILEEGIKDLLSLLFILLSLE